MVIALQGSQLLIFQDVSGSRCSRPWSRRQRRSFSVSSAPALSCSQDSGIQRRISLSISRTFVARLGHGGSVAVANPSRPAIASRPAVFVNVPTARPVNAAIAETAGEGLKWWERGGAPNMHDVHSTQEFVDALASAGDKLVIVEFFATWCGSCRALYPKFCKLAAEYSDIIFLKVNFDENKPMCKSLNVKVLPFFHIYRGAEGRLDSFSCSLSKLQKLKDAIAKHHDGVCEDCAPSELMSDILAALLEKKHVDQPASAAGSSE